MCNSRRRSDLQIYAKGEGAVARERPKDGSAVVEAHRVSYSAALCREVTEIQM